MKKIYKLIRNNPFMALIMPTSMGFMNFLGNLLISYSDGSLSDDEFHNLLAHSTGIETVLLIVIMVALRKR